jgi:hypothetical protein
LRANEVAQKGMKEEVDCWKGMGSGCDVGMGVDAGGYEHDCDCGTELVVTVVGEMGWSVDLES